MSTIAKQNHETHKFLSKKFLAEIKKTGDEVVKSIQVVNQDYWNKMIPSLLNHLIFDLQVAVHNFQQIEIKAKAEKFEKADLQNVINIFSKMAYELQQELGKNLDISKSLLETYIPQIVDVAETLLAVIEDDKLHQYKVEQVELLCALLVALNQISTTLEMENPKEISNFIKRKIEQFNKLFDEIDSDAPKTVENLRKHINRVNVQSAKIMQHLYKQSDNYDDKLQNEILRIGDLLQLGGGKISVDMKDSTNGKQAIAHIKYMYNYVFELIIKFIEYLVTESKHLSVPENAIVLARYLGNQVMGILTRDIEYISSYSVVSPQK